ncbi:uncharacterized protein LOC144356695 [Saccoglossus kowalevskii]
MALDSALKLDNNYIQSMVSAGRNYKFISCHIQSMHPGVRGISERSVRRYCKRYNIGRMRDQKLDASVTQAIQEVGPSYGVKTMMGYINFNGLVVGLVRLRDSLKRSHPDYYEMRRNNTVRHTNPSPYSAAYFGNKLHVDQNEKLVAYEVTHIVFIDG